MQNGTLTKIDPNSLKFKPLGVSQHATGSRGRVTTIVKPVQQPLVSPPEPIVFDADPLNLTGECLEDECSDDDNDIAKGYYAGSVCMFYRFGDLISHPRIRTIRYCLGGPNARRSLTNSPDSKAEEFSPMTSANSAERMASSAASIASLFNSSAGIA